MSLRIFEERILFRYTNSRELLAFLELALAEESS
jgi:hypothetical protein